MSAPGAVSLTRPTPRPAASVRLVCVHAAGMSQLMYRGWAQELPSDVEVLLVQLPGRDQSLRQPLMRDFAAVLDGIDACLSADGDHRPYAVFGHSMGARLGFGIAAHRAAVGRPPLRLFASACPPPDLFGTGLPDRSASDAELTTALARLGGTPPEVLASPELLGIYLPIFRADLEVCRTASSAAQSGRLACPVSVFGGVDDALDPHDLARWSDWTERGSSVRIFPGNHFYVTGQSRDLALRAIWEDLERDVH